MKKAEYKALLDEWKIRLGLYDWHIKLYPKCKPEEMAMEDVAGCSSWEETIKTARIDILNPKYYGNRLIKFDWEKTLVHELLHLKLCLVSDKVDEFQGRYMHQIIDDLARALIDAKRFEKEREGKGGK